MPQHEKNCAVSAVGFLGWYSSSEKTYSFEMVFCEEFISCYCSSWEIPNKMRCVARTYFDHPQLLQDCLLGVDSNVPVAYSHE